MVGTCECSNGPLGSIKCRCVTWLDGDWLDTKGGKVLRLCYQTTTEADLLLEAATTIICTVECS